MVEVYVVYLSKFKNVIGFIRYFCFDVFLGEMMLFDGDLFFFFVDILLLLFIFRNEYCWCCNIFNCIK